jgi:hypothetical protein
MLIKDNVPALHKEIAECLDENSNFSNYLQAFSVVDSRRHMISRIMFIKGGLKSFLEDCRNPESAIFVSPKAEASACCTRLSLYLCDRMAEFNTNRPEGKGPVPFGSKIWVGQSLGIYFTIGNQDLERFFEEGKRLTKLAQEAIVDGGDHRYGDPG